MKKLMVVLMFLLVGCTSKEDIAKDYLHDILKVDSYEIVDCENGDMECVVDNYNEVTRRIEVYHDSTDIDYSYVHYILNSALVNEDIVILEEEYQLNRGVNNVEQVEYEILLQLYNGKITLRGHIVFDGKEIVSNQIVDGRMSN